MSYDISVYKPTDDDWSNYYSDLVQVRLCKTTDDMWRVCVWGDDDIGMEIDYQHNQESYALTMFMQVVGLERVNMETLSKMGFYAS